MLYRNTGRGAFADVSEAAGITRAAGTYGLGVSTLDFDDDGWTDLYVANDSNPSALYRNRRDGTFEDIAIPAGCAYSQDGKPQAGMGLAIGDYDRNGTIDIFKTNFAGDTSTLYANTGDGPLRGSHVRERRRDQHQMARVGRRIPRRRSSTAGSICSSSTGMSIPRWSRSGPKRDTASARCSIAICATAGSRT